MELDKFVESTLIQIAKGVAGAQSQVAALGGNVNPEKASSLGAAHAARQNTEPKRFKSEQIIEFDIGLQVVEESHIGGSGGIKMLAFSIGSEGNSKDTLKSVHRIKFSVPMQLP
ncbi:Hypothetical protein VCSRO70_3443 [Vibrio cholerae]|uniref:hypothetical protein n=1 Tax=Vibrio TaxID=662 RepID=UPI000218FA8C|nr:MULTISPECIES: hypothetical protein [Vibrio]EGQ9414892.1 hypothetical protein [Vibrio cholerae]EGQ95898.1 hypothetical protein VCHE39_3649 [Vibrio cholerae HE39]EGR0469037.1 hypothetical protein [Vibrio cholerae]EGR1913182.1 hypothetical protein [Vibrio cholerae]EGR2435341.1 hypothetical protein [Vibrio cholerae]